MTKTSNDNQRTYWTNFLLDILQHPEQQDLHDDAACLLQLFASKQHAAIIETLLLDRDRSAWLRTYLLRAMVDRRLPASVSTIEALVEEFSRGLCSEGRKEKKPHRLACIYDVSKLVALAQISGQEPLADKLLQTLEGDVLRELLRSSDTRAKLGPHLEVAYQRVLELGMVDRELAWETPTFAESQAILFADADNLNFDRLDQATRDLSNEVLDDIAAAYPEVLAAAANNLALTVDYLIERYPEDMLRATAHRQIAALDRRLQNGEQHLRYWKPLQVLSRLSDAVAALDALLGEDNLADSIRMVAAALRLRLQPSANYAALPRRAVDSYLQRSSADEQHRPLFVWAVSTTDPALQYMALQGLLRLDGKLDTLLVNRFVNAAEPLVRLTVLEAAAANGDPQAAAELVSTAKEAPDVISRAHALRSLRRCKPPVADYFQLCAGALEHDKEVFDDFYAPCTAEAALCLSRREHLEQSQALQQLVQAGLTLQNDDVWWAIESAILSWLEGTPAGINSVFYARLLLDAKRLR